MATRRPPSRMAIGATLLAAAVIGFLLGALVAATDDDPTSAPRPTGTDIASPSPTTSPTAQPTPSPTVAGDARLTLSADRESADTRELIQLTGVLTPAQEGVVLQVQQSVDGIGFADFPVEATTRADGSFAIKVRTGRVGTNEFRMVWPAGDPQVVSNAVSVEIG